VWWDPKIPPHAITSKLRRSVEVRERIVADTIGLVPVDGTAMSVLMDMAGGIDPERADQEARALLHHADGHLDHVLDDTGLRGERHAPLAFPGAAESEIRKLGDLGLDHRLDVADDVVDRRAVFRVRQRNGRLTAFRDRIRARLRVRDFRAAVVGVADTSRTGGAHVMHLHAVEGHGDFCGFRRSGPHDVAAVPEKDVVAGLSVLVDHLADGNHAVEAARDVQRIADHPSGKPLSVARERDFRQPPDVHLQLSDGLQPLRHLGVRLSDRHQIGVRRGAAAVCTTGRRVELAVPRRIPKKGRVDQVAELVVVPHSLFKGSAGAESRVVRQRGVGRHVRKHREDSESQRGRREQILAIEHRVLLKLCHPLGMAVG
jgi:hypothetical protein